MAQQSKLANSAHYLPYYSFGDTSATQGTPPSRDDLKWVANTTTLIYGERVALLVDTFLSNEQTAELADWIAAKG